MEILKNIGLAILEIFEALLKGTGTFIKAHPKVFGALTLISLFIYMLRFQWFMDKATVVIGLAFVGYIFWPRNDKPGPEKKKKKGG